MVNGLTSLPLLTLLTFSPLLGVLILLFVPKGRTRAIQIIGIAATFLPLILALTVYGIYDLVDKGASLTEQYAWISLPLNLEIASGIQSWSFNIDYHLAIDGLSLPLVVMTTIVASMAAIASLGIKKRWKTYYILFLLLEVGMIGVFLARDLLLFFMFFEWTLVPTFFLIGIWGLMHREKAANRFLVYNGLGSALLLVAFVILTVTAGFTTHPDFPDGGHYIYSSNLNVIMDNLGSASAYVNQADYSVFYLTAGMKTTVFVLLLIAFGIKLPFFPFHTWMLKVHAEAPAPVVMLHSGILLKMGAYGLVQFGAALLPQETASWATVLAVLGVINVLYGAVLAFRQRELRLLLAYSSISHMGFVLLGVAAMNELGIQGAVVQMVSHGFISALFFLLVGSLSERTGTTRIGELGGLAKSMPFLCGILLLAGLASLGLPGLSGFVAELLTLLGLYGTASWAAILGALGLIFSAVYVLRGVLAISYGPMDDRFAGLKDARLAEAIPIMVLTACIVLIGLFPSFVTAPIDNSVAHIIELFKVRG
ncbi:complex I subunit 4 family protein [Paenibacillus dendritiformis]|uniref:NADH:ubiquinone oxidoreductase subunit M n=1 Tax=Paenibacillus dendritiformis C454 TaxID=1131935 RepID=H3SQ15_9BACL|nr:NADH-quinone oxidoreductase subunit M [Paenibacillus dendritiformis]EHQ58807.1 NADH:ubiquinone oxidoreductase subunit M [Paenibacillus dendritiformis C454]CAH8767445.1 NADH-quinone oxidoreductase subunit M [Paenibacillus dendritiformis]